MVSHGNEWAIKGAGNSKYTLITDTQSEAIEIAKGIAQNKGSELFIHNRHGQIREETRMAMTQIRQEAKKRYLCNLKEL